ncbi:katG [Symbiodinium natans]|uniref:KatG protein n=1 Tax=Symbiodinium natans TaxID=878477 RepID=A0A812MJK6_9DINO|nr:katG [Symbiodinium natans]
MKLPVVCVLPALAAAACPYMDQAVPPASSLPVAVPDAATYAAALPSLDIKALEQDLTHAMTASKTCWPADGGHYGGLMIRLAWHCSGTYRDTDGRGGCSGARIRFQPEIGWMDNGNLDKALSLLVAIKNTYGDALSWGDLITFAGTVAVRSMGGPTLPHCFGRIDEKDGANSEIFGTTANWSATGCETQGDCQKPLGATTVGLIYVNPEGPLDNATGRQNPDPVASGAEIREVFGRMAMNDTETAALIAGGHAFGMCHGHTSGFEGPWTKTPSSWTYDFIHGMLEDEWEKVTDANTQGLVQWRTINRTSRHASTMRLTSDLALVKDAVYKPIIEDWAANPEKLDVAFAAAWDKLLTSGTTWSTAKRCETTATTTTSVDSVQTSVSTPIRLSSLLVLGGASAVALS